MYKNKELFITAFALFSMFFGAGNLLLPPLLGYQATTEWFWVTAGFMITAVVIPIIGILAHARLQGTIYDFGKKVSPVFSTIYCLVIYAIAVAIPSPRTAAATHEISIFPNFGTDALITSSIYFVLVFIFALYRSSILNIIGKFLTPLIVIILLLIIGIGLTMPHETMSISAISAPIVSGLQEGYQTFDAIGAIVVGGVVIISLNLKGYQSFEVKKKLIALSGWIAGSGLFIIYAGLILLGAFYSSEVDIMSSMDSDMKRAALLRGISLDTLGNIGTAFLSVLVALACFTTAVGIVTGTSDYFKKLLGGSRKVYVITAIVSCLIGILVGQLNFNNIVMVAIPVLQFIYPITIVLILLNVLSDRIATPLVFRGVVGITFVFGALDALIYITKENELLSAVRSYVPLGSLGFGWILPAILVFTLMVLMQQTKRS